MTQSAGQGFRIGDVLVEQGVLSPFQVQRILDAQRESHRPFGDLAERLFGVAPEAVEQAWVRQYSHEFGAIDLRFRLIADDVLSLLSRRQAWQFRLLPVGRCDGQVELVTDTEALLRSVNFVTRSFREPAVLLLADAADLTDHLQKHYPVPPFMQDYQRA